jgi:hypothetical protein
MEHVGASIKREDVVQLEISYRNVPAVFELAKKLLHELVGPVLPEGILIACMELTCGGIGKLGIAGAVPLLG